MNAFQIHIAQKPAPRILTIGDDDRRAIIAALTAAPTPTVADYERNRDLIDLFAAED